MTNRQKTRRPPPKMVLRLPDLEQSKNAVLNSLAAPSFRESYRRAMEEFIAWYCPEPRLSFSRTGPDRERKAYSHGSGPGLGEANGH